MRGPLNSPTSTIGGGAARQVSDVSGCIDEAAAARLYHDPKFPETDEGSAGTRRIVGRTARATGGERNAVVAAAKVTRSPAGLCVGVDVGGTFTDAVFVAGSQLWRAKAPTTHDDVGRGVIDACRRAALAVGLSLEEVMPAVSRFGLGTTVVTNVFAGRSGVPVGLLTTAGFEDYVVHRKRRGSIDAGILGPADEWREVVDAIVPRDRIFGLDERIDRDGQVLVPLDASEAVERGAPVDRRGARSIAVVALVGGPQPLARGLGRQCRAGCLPGYSGGCRL